MAKLGAGHVTVLVCMFGQELVMKVHVCTEIAIVSWDPISTELMSAKGRECKGIGVG